MVIELKELLTTADKEQSFEAKLEQTSVIVNGDEYPIVKQSPFTLSMKNVSNRELSISADLEIVVSIPCDRCLEAVERTLSLQIEEKLKLDGAGEIVSGKEETADYMIGSGLDVDKLIYGEILVNWPAKVLCKEDCRGICSKCGTNLNVRTCDCDQTELDPRMAVIQDIFNQFKEV
ncbi:MAG: DUF177 domain-containing protein [Eubacterium sp.]|nr:DUF177 domain-containing protein [Eubacterium sp.]